VKPRKDEVWLIDFGDPIGREQAGRRPAVVVSVNSLNESQAGVMIVVPITRSRRNLPSHVELEPDTSGLSEVSYAKCEDIKSVSEYRLITRIGSVAEEASFQIRRVLGFLLGI